MTERHSWRDMYKHLVSLQDAGVPLAESYRRTAADYAGADVQLVRTIADLGVEQGWALPGLPPDQRPPESHRPRCRPSGAKSPKGTR